MDLSGLGAFAGGLFQGYNTEQDEMTRQALKNLYIQQYRNQQAGDVAGWNALQGGFQPGSNTGYGPSAQGGVPSGQGGIGGDQMASAIYGQESSSGANTKTSPTGAVGGMQIEPSTWKMFARSGENINNPHDNIVVGTRIVSAYEKAYNGDPARVAVAYFSGPGNVAPPGSPTPWKVNKSDGRTTVSEYVDSVLGRLHGRGAGTGGPHMSTAMALLAQGGPQPANVPSGQAQNAQFVVPSGGVPTAALQRAQMGQQQASPAISPEFIQGPQQGAQGQPSALEQAVKRIAAMHLPPAQSMATLRAVMPLLDTQSKLELQQIMMGLREQNLQQRERYQDESLDLRRQAQEDRKTATEAKQRLAEAKFEELKNWRERTAQDAETKWAQTLQIKNADQRLKAQAQIANQLRQATQQKISALNAEVNAAGLAMDDETRQKFVEESKSLYDETEKKIQDLQKQQPEQGEQPATSAGTVGGIVQPQAEQAKPKVSDEQKTALRAQAKAAIARTGNPDAVRAKYKELTGEDLGE